MQTIDKDSLEILKVAIKGLGKLIQDDTIMAEKLNASSPSRSMEDLKTQIPLMTQNIVILMGEILLEAFSQDAANDKDHHD